MTIFHSWRSRNEFLINDLTKVASVNAKALPAFSVCSCGLRRWEFAVTPGSCALSIGAHHRAGLDSDGYRQMTGFWRSTSVPVSRLS
jgi:hypothetical protein